MLGKTVKLVLAVAAVGAFGACARQADVAAERQAIDAMNAKWLEAIAAKDVTTIVDSLYAEDAVFMPPNAPKAAGRAALRTQWEEFLKAPNMKLTFGADTIEVAQSGDLAYDRGWYEFSMDSPSGPFQDRGKYVVVWRKVAGQWRAVIDMFNSDMPMPGAVAAPPADTQPAPAPK